MDSLQCFADHYPAILFFDWVPPLAHNYFWLHKWLWRKSTRVSAVSDRNNAPPHSLMEISYLITQSPSSQGLWRRRCHRISMRKHGEATDVRFLSPMFPRTHLISSSGTCRSEEKHNWTIYHLSLFWFVVLFKLSNKQTQINTYLLLMRMKRQNVVKSIHNKMFHRTGTFICC